MNNFSRVIRHAVRYRVTLVASIFCALAIALLWGGNISAVYPFIEAVLYERSVPEKIDSQIAERQAAKVDNEQKIVKFQNALKDCSPEDRAELEQSLTEARTRLMAEEKTLAWNRWIKGYADAYLPRDNFKTLLLIVAFLLTSTIVKGLFIVAHMNLVARLAERVNFDMRVEFYRRTLDLDLASLGENARGDLINRFTKDLHTVGAGILMLFGRAIREPFKMIVCFAGAAYLSWRLLLISLFIAPFAAWLVNWLSKALKRANRRAMEEMSQISNTLSETLSGMKVVKAFTMEPYELNRLRQTAKIYFNKAMRIARYNSISRPLTELMGIAIFSMAIMAGGYMALNHQTHIFGIKMSDRPLSQTELLVFFGFLAGVSDPARKISDVFNGLQQSVAASDRVYEVLDRRPLICDPPHPKPLVRHHRELRIDGVHFHYDPDKPVLIDVDLRIAFGETVAIVGPNGCGKSTLANLVPRFFDPTGGRVTLDGLDLRDVRLRELREQIGLVTQETLLFDDTVENNIRYGAMHAPREQVVAAARQAHAHRFIEEKLVDGYETVVGPGGNRLSGGQRQRIVLARAILRDPAILIMDEATSQIDMESEQLIQQVLERFTHNRTTLIITHRLSALALADRIVVMNHGRIIDIGTQQELSARCDFFRRLYSIELKESA